MATNLKTRKARTPKTNGRSTKKLARPHVISFRLTTPQHDQLATVLDLDTPTGVDSTKQLARKMVLDCLAGRLRYVKPADRLKDCELITE